MPNFCQPYNQRKISTAEAKIANINSKEANLKGFFLSSTNICDSPPSPQKFTINACELTEGRAFAGPRGQRQSRAQMGDRGGHRNNFKLFPSSVSMVYCRTKRAWLLLCGSPCASWAEKQCRGAFHPDITDLPSCWSYRQPFQEGY